MNSQWIVPAFALFTATASWAQDSAIEFQELKLLEGPKSLPELEKRTYQKQFNKTTTRFVHCEVTSKNLRHNVADQTVVIVLKYFKPDGSLFGSPKIEYKVPRDWKTAVLWKGWGWDAAGNWTEGTYTVEVWFDGKTKVATSTFTIVDDRPEDVKRAEKARLHAEKLLNDRDVQGARREFTRAIEAKSDDAQAYLGRARVNQILNEFAAAEADCSKAIELDPNSASAFSQRASCYAAMGKFDRAIEDAKKCTQLNPKGYYWTQRARLHERIGDDEGALLTLSLAIELNPTRTDVYTSRAQFYSDRGEFDKSIADYDKAIELDPKSTWFFKSRARAYALAGKFEAALADARKATDPSALAEIFLLKGDAESALEVYSTATSAVDLLRRAEIHGYTHQYDKAVQDCLRAIESKPTGSDAHHKCAVYLASAGDHDRAIRFAKEASAIASANPSKYGHNFAHTFALEAQASASWRKGEPQEAIRVLDQALSIYPQHNFAYSSRARYRAMTGDFDGARKDLEQSKKWESASFPSSDRVYVMMMLGDWATALKELNEYRRKSGERWREEWHAALQWVIQSKLGKAEDARRELDDYLAQTKNLRPGFLGRSWCRFLAGRLSEKELLDSAEAFDLRSRDIEVSGACYIAGIKRLVQGDDQGAKALFRRCVETGRHLHYGLQDFAELSTMELVRAGEIKPPAPKPAGGPVVIRMRDGSQYKGTIEHEDESTVRIRTALSVFTLKRSDIDRIDR